MVASYSPVSLSPLTKLFHLFSPASSNHSLDLYLSHMDNTVQDLSSLALLISVDPNSSAVLLEMTEFHSLHGQITFHCTFVLYFHHPFISQWALGLILFLYYFSNLVISVRLKPFTLLEMHREIVGVYGHSIFNF